MDAAAKVPIAPIAITPVVGQHVGDSTAGTIAEAEQALKADRLGPATERFTKFYGSPKFLIGQTALVGAWMAENQFGPVKVDPYPFIFLNLMFSAVGGSAASIVLTAQNRQALRDKIETQHSLQQTNQLLQESLAREAKLESTQTQLLGKVDDIAKALHK